MDAREEREKRLKRLKQKRIALIATLFLVVLGVGGGYYLAKQFRIKKATEAAEKKAEENKTEAFQITEFTLADATAVEVKNEHAKMRFEWVYTNEEKHLGGWVKTGEEDFPTKATAVQAMIGSVCLLSGTTKIAAADVNPSDYGLDAPKVQLKVILKDGTEPEFTIGNQTPYSEGYYLRDEATGDVYVVASDVFHSCNTTVIDMAMSETFPSTSVTSITEVIIAVQGQEPVSYTRTIKEDGSSDYPPIFADCTTFVASKVQEYNCKDFSQYGLDEPYAIVSVLYNDRMADENGEEVVVPCMMFVEIGDKTVSGNYYVRVNDSNYVYIMTQAFVEKFIPEE